MRELTLLESGCLAGLLLLSLVLPLLLSLRGPQDPALRRAGLRTVWLGQAIVAGTGLCVILSATLASYATAFGLASCLGCAFALRRQTMARQYCELREPRQ